MPHVGGCGGSGASGGCNSGGDGGHRAPIVTPKYYYYNNRMIPFSQKDRRGKFFASQILTFIFGLCLFALAGVGISQKGSYDENTLNKYSMSKYSEIYNEKSNDYESNILVTIVTYENPNKYDYVCVVGNDVGKTIDICFGNLASTFGSALTSNIPLTNCTSNLYKNLTDSIESVITYLQSTHYDEYGWMAESIFGGAAKKASKQNVNVINKSAQDVDAENLPLLLAECSYFYQYTGYNVSFIIDSNNNIFGINWAVVGVLSGFGAIFTIVAIIELIKKKKDVAALQNLIYEGKAEEYLKTDNGERDPFEEYYENQKDFMDK